MQSVFLVKMKLHILGWKNSLMHVRYLTHEHFDSEKYDLYYQFLCERQRIWVRRAHLEMERPWTTDRTLNYEFITNVYRELDPGTEYVLDSLGTAPLEHIDIVFNIMVYRLMGSQISTHANLGILSASDFSTKRFLRLMGKLTTNPFGDAYRVAGYGDGTGSKIENVAGVLAELARAMPEFYRRMIGAPNARDLYNTINSIAGFGTFLSNQVMVDMLMLDEGTHEHWAFGTDEWCEPGPGAKRGITALLAPGVKPKNMQMVMAWLRDAQQAEFERLGLTFPYLLNADDSPKRLSICNIQTTLCEFSKYVRSRGHVNVRAYTSVPSKLQPFDITLSPDEIEDLRDTTAVTPPENSYRAPTVIPEDEELDPLPEPVPTSAVQNAPTAAAPTLVPSVFDPAPSAAPAPFLGGQFDPNMLSWLAPLLNQHQQTQKPIVVPVDPTGLMGLPKAIVIVPIY